MNLDDLLNDLDKEVVIVDIIKWVADHLHVGSTAPSCGQE